MAIIKPFKGIRPPQALIEQVASRPYDVLNSEEARKEAEGNEKSLYHIIKPEIDFPVGTDEHDEAVYQKAAENFAKFKKTDGWYKTKKTVLCICANYERPYPVRTGGLCICGRLHEG
jgi:Uncharacterized conserved protein